MRTRTLSASRRDTWSRANQTRSLVNLRYVNEMATLFRSILGVSKQWPVKTIKRKTFSLGSKFFRKFRFWASFWTWIHQSDPAHTQCRPEAGYTHSVCRQCCYTGNGHSFWTFKIRPFFTIFTTWWSVRKDSCVSSPTFWQPTTRAEWSFWACKSNKITFPSDFCSITQFSSGPIAFVCYSERIYYHDVVFTRMTTSHPSDSFLRVSNIKLPFVLLWWKWEFLFYYQA